VPIHGATTRNAISGIYEVKHWLIVSEKEAKEKIGIPRHDQKCDRWYIGGQTGPSLVKNKQKTRQRFHVPIHGATTRDAIGSI
jgi:hypothetical protein